MSSNMEQRHLERAAAILKKVPYLTIATICEDGQPWNSPVSASLKEGFTFEWGSNSENVHSQNIRRDGRIFAVVYDSTAPEGTGEGVYLRGKAEEVRQENDAIAIYQFTPEEAWINDEAKREDGSYKHDIRVSLELEALKALVRA